MTYVIVTPKRTPSITPSLPKFCDENEWFYFHEIRPLIKQTFPTINKCMSYLMPTPEQEKLEPKTYKFQLQDGTFQGVLQLNGWFCNGTEIRFNLPQWQKFPIFAKIRESQILQMQEFYRQCCIILDETTKIKENHTDLNKLIITITNIIEACAKALRLLDNPPKKGLFPEYEPSLLYQEPQPPANCIFEIYIQHREFIIKVYGLEIKQVELSTSVETQRNSFQLTRPVIQQSKLSPGLSKKSKTTLLSRSQSAQPDDFLLTSVEWGCGEGMMGYPKGTKPVVIQNKYPTVTYLYNKYEVTVMAKREVHITIEQLDSIYNDIHELQIQWTHVLHNLKQLILIQ
ncbi:hypothetical protein ENU1_115000 [Entamoeba nuttalli P19]|uniref:Uncharacterized protein n=1 Tax=Entamoeba nuttalli (strain P19) TaxID=1076696 RepID=K2HUA8_ENTNP|nr:hypothetical protein ENU1_115000 [Entamoeba nuttalli P19]EKE39780.1 hypothetical protein ENU1_115000 [Entamoeba nuttalli P19]|eukprot:XP_008857887.1 hypothetical protein ENU1_115000 [Entamoeba nuttalli P19]